MKNSTILHIFSTFWAARAKKTGLMMRCIKCRIILVASREINCKHFAAHKSMSNNFCNVCYLFAFVKLCAITGYDRWCKKIENMMMKRILHFMFDFNSMIAQRTKNHWKRIEMVNCRDLNLRDRKIKYLRTSEFLQLSRIGNDFLFVSNK